MSTEPETPETAEKAGPGTPDPEAGPGTAPEPEHDAPAGEPAPGGEAAAGDDAAPAKTAEEDTAAEDTQGGGADAGSVAGARDADSDAEGAAEADSVRGPEADAEDAEGTDRGLDSGAEDAGAGSDSGAEGTGSGSSADVEGTGAGSDSGAESTSTGSDPDAEDTGSDSGADAEGTGTGSDSGAEGAAAAGLSEAAAELAAQRAERERIERRKAEKKAPIESGAKLSGRAADLLAAVRAVESGDQPAQAVYTPPEPEPAQRRAAPEPVRRPGPVTAEAAAVPAAPAPGTVEAVHGVLGEGGAPESLALPVAAALGEGAADRLRADPWQLLHVTGVRPEQADGFARALLGAESRPDDERRGRAFTVWLLEQAALAGHTSLEASALTAALAQRGVPDADAALQSALAEGEALVFQDALEEPGAPAAAPNAEGDGDEDESGEERPVRLLVGLERYALAEESLADGLGRLINSAPGEDVPAEDWERVAAPARGSAGELVRAVSGHGLVLHSGGAASRAEPALLLAGARALGLRAWAAAHSPLGRDDFAELVRAAGARRAPERGRAQGAEAGDPQAAEAGRAQDGEGASGGAEDAAVVTVAGLLSGAEGPGRDADGALDLDLLVVLDAPQLDVETAALLVESLPDGARLVLSGDPAVLWSAGPGRVFADLLAARVCPHVASRVADPGPLGELVSGIGVGELNQVAAPGKEFVVVPVRDAGEAVHRTVQLVADSVPRAIGVPAEQTVVITPGHGGAVGTRALNAALKERLNPGPGRFGGFDPGDRIVHSPVPGRALPGRVVTADAEGLHLSCSGDRVVVPRERVESCVRHGWALTAHQAVGGRWPAAVVVLPGDAAQALSRPWVYTAFGRASRHLSVVHGVEQALPRAVAEVPARPRTTRLPLLLAAQAAQAEDLAQA
ncbi:helix-hairpin-helix domain-containing protein [Streptomyces similanensis]|uniref:Helix-hairpin-helix domain-containing protein n=1 Tax=Streptomyces similanensis TaxID=1274988 RepID=A0ABP9KEP6_9ACTN